MQRMDRYPERHFAAHPLHWHEWLLVLLLLFPGAGVRAAPVYKCIGDAGAVAYQDQPCAGAQIERVIEIAPAPAYAKSPEYAFDKTAPRRASTARAGRRAAQPTSFECRAADGQVFYRHGGCPHSVAADAHAARASPRRSGKAGASASSVSVSAHPIGRDEACRRIHAAGSIGRAGHEHDDDVTTYERNLGHDPCR